MKLKRIYPILLFLILSVTLSACSGSQSFRATSWPGVTVDQDTVYVAYQEQVLAIRAKDGGFLWGYPAEPSARQLFYSPPAVSDGLLIAGGFFNDLYALDANTGAEKWQFTEAKDRYIGHPLFLNDLVLVPNADDNLYALDQNGNLKWKFTAGEALWSQPIPDGDRIFVASMDHSLYAVDPSDGSQIWKTDLGGSIVSSPTFVDGTLYAGSLAQEVVAVDAASGKILWRFPVSGMVWGSPSYHEGALYFGDLNGTVYAVDAEKGTELWKQEGLGAITGNMTVFTDGIAFLTEENGVRALSFSGEQLWSLLLNGKLYGEPVLAGEYLIVPITAGDQLLVAVDFSGNQRWAYTPAK